MSTSAPLPTEDLDHEDEARTCPDCGSTETTELNHFDGRYEQSITVCADCGSDAP